MNYTITSDRTAHITESTDDAIIKAALEARSDLAARRREEKDATRNFLNTGIVAENAASIGERIYGIAGAPTGALLHPVRRNAANWSTTLKRSFRFTIEGRDGTFKLMPVHSADQSIHERLHGGQVIGYRIEQIVRSQF